MNKAKVVKVYSWGLEFDNGARLDSKHATECCESHYLSLADLTIDDFEGLEFDLTSDDFFGGVDGYGITLNPLVGHPVRIPGYGDNNGYYSSQLDLVLSDGKGSSRVFDISKYQAINRGV
jgi:hypothetical protein